MSFSIQNLILGLIGLGIGVWMTYSAYYINHHLLFAGWVERKWGPGMGTTFYRLLGVFICLFSILVMIGIIDLFGSSLGPQTDLESGSPGLIPGNSTNQNGRIAE